VRFFAGLMLMLQRAGRLRGTQVRALLRLMRAYAAAWLNVEPLPVPPRWVTRPGLPLVLWAAWRVSFENPTLFVIGMIALVPAIPMLFYTVGRVCWRLVRLALLGGA